MKTILYESTERVEVDFGWFKAKYSFSFGQWHNPNRMNFGALRVFNDSLIQPHKGFPTHPHDNMEVITVQLQGKLTHTDVSGTRIIEAGDVQVITAGSGVTHSDLNIGEEEANQFQIWIYPDKQNVQPQSHTQHYTEDERKGKWQCLASPYGDESSQLNLQQDAWMCRGVFEKDATTNYKTHKPNNGFYIFVIEGNIEVGGQTLARRDAIGISESSEINFRCLEQSDVLLIEVPMVF